MTHERRISIHNGRAQEIDPILIDLKLERKPKPTFNVPSWFYLWACIALLAATAVGLYRVGK